LTGGWRSSRPTSQVAVAQSGSQALAHLELDLEALRAELKSTPLWRPDFDLSASLGLPDPSKYNFAASLSFSPADINNDEREDLQEEIDEKIVDIRSEQYELSLQKQLIEQSIAIARQACEAATLAREQAAIILRESQFLHKQGELTVFELEQASLSLRSAEIDSFAAAADLYQAQSELLMLHVFKK
jgi:hypothetical protein